jgi:hypothetical protein
MAGRAVRAGTLAGVAGVVVVGAVVPLVAVVVADGDEGRLGWVVVAGAAACASGLAFGLTQRLLPSVALALVSAVALTVVVSAPHEEPVREFVFRTPAAETRADAQRSRGNALETTMGRGDVAGARAERSRGNVVAPGAERSRGNVAVARFVRGYYAAVDAGRFEDAWSRLAAADEGASFAVWRAGYATTVGHRVEHVRTGPDGVVRYTLVAVDRTPCGTTTERRFAIRWRLVRPDGRLTATALGAVKLSGVDPVAAC